jgi:hypothetical protein
LGKKEKRRRRWGVERSRRYRNVDGHELGSRGRKAHYR